MQCRKLFGRGLGEWLDGESSQAARTNLTKRLIAWDGEA